MDDKERLAKAREIIAKEGFSDEKKRKFRSDLLMWEGRYDELIAQAKELDHRGRELNEPDLAIRSKHMWRVIYDAITRLLHASAMTQDMFEDFPEHADIKARCEEHSDWLAERRKIAADELGMGPN